MKKKNFRKVQFIDILGNIEQHAAHPATSSVYEQIDEILHSIQELLKISVKIDQYFGRQILCCLTSGFVCITVQLYYMINNMRFGFEGIEQILTVCSCILITIHFIEFSSILMAGDKVKKEVSLSWNCQKFKISKN